MVGLQALEAFVVLSIRVGCPSRIVLGQLKIHMVPTGDQIYIRALAVDLASLQ
jgi:hypothetical protein